MCPRVHQEDEDKLKATVKQAAKDRTVTGSVTANAGTNLNTSGLAITNPETDDNSISSGGVRETPIVLLYGCSETNGAIWQRLKTDDSNRLLVKAFSDDMARKAYYDRNCANVPKNWWSSVEAHESTVRWTYEVPESKTAMHGIVFYDLSVDINLAGRFISAQHWISIDAGSNYLRVASLTLSPGETSPKTETTTAVFVLVSGDIIRCLTFSNDDVEHGMSISSVLTEFDE